ncbi:GNAT family N-acetyltransferase [Pseudofrankia sp. DC12]|uniref:GNAT family N-acetyltransferase n=1 Tax=Pseudofrankia sp. DC12 TaxID=683315 RepID=UPI0005F848C7|nr:GNAT family N-acetyltransferase [Pseudofrankia sp. DC12]
MAPGRPSQADGAVLVVRPGLTYAELNGLFGASWPGRGPASFAPVLSRSLTWIAARRGERLVGFVNVVGDGGVHAFILDTTVHPDVRRQGLGIRLVLAAADEARARGAEWLHVDYEPHLKPFYQRCGFRQTAAGLLQL